MAQQVAWPNSSVCLSAEYMEVETLARKAYQRTCRFGFEEPGFCLLDVGSAIGSVNFRRLMVDLKNAMSTIHQSITGLRLIYLSATRFDQQSTTKFHLDGGPDECFLMLGYEPSEVEAELEIADYAKCAFDLGISPKEFMDRYNPMFKTGSEMLWPYTTRIPCFSRANYQIICINNSSAPFFENKPAWQGTLHTASIIAPDENKRRIINSTMIAPAAEGVPDGITDAEQEEFINTPIVRRRGYDKQHLADDLT
ncbi:MAG: hypothetical protein WD030_09090 [Pirellulales bacterium]